MQQLQSMVATDRAGSGECCLKLKLARENRSSQRTMPQMKNILPHGNSSFNTLFSYGTQLILEGDKWTARVFAMLASFSFFKECIAVYVYTWTEQKLPLVGRSYLNWMALMTTRSSQITGSKFLPLTWMRSTKRSSLWRRWDSATTWVAAYLGGRWNAARCSVALDFFMQITVLFNVKWPTGKDTRSAATRWRRILYFMRKNHELLPPR